MGAAPPLVQLAANHPVDVPRLSHEFHRLARYVAGIRPTEYQTGKYVDFHRRRGLAPRHAFDRLLFGLSRGGWLGIALADAYTGTLCRASLVRQKLMLTLAILESSAPSFETLDEPDPGGKLVFVYMAWRIAGAAVLLALAALLLVPLHAGYAMLGRTRRT
jgi:hypothetical protein